MELAFFSYFRGFFQDLHQLVMTGVLARHLTSVDSVSSLYLCILLCAMLISHDAFYAGGKSRPAVIKKIFVVQEFSPIVLFVREGGVCALRQSICCQQKLVSDVLELLFVVCIDDHVGVNVCNNWYWLRLA